MKESENKLYYQIIKKVFLIIKVFYSKYLYIFLFNNIISYLIYIKDIF